MSSYNVFSLFYDSFTKDVKYPDRAKYILSLFQKFDRQPTLLLDLACGTGNFSTEFARQGIEVIGVDISEDMLAVANDKNSELEKPVLYLCQPAEELELYGTVDGAVCLLDSLNHITNYENFKKAIAKTALFLEPRRLFIFDINTVYKHKKVLANNTFREKQGGVTLDWSNEYDERDDSVTIRLDFTLKTGIFKKEYYTEEFKERAYSEEMIAAAISEAGLELIAIYGEGTEQAPKENSERNIYITRRLKNG